MGGHVTILAFGSAQDVLGWQTRRVALLPPATVESVIAALEHEHPRLTEARGRLRFAVNQMYADTTATLQPGDELAIIPPVAGGDSRPPPARLVREPIDVATLVKEVEAPAAGAVASFLGVVRSETAPDGRALTALEYTAYEPMALRHMLHCCERAGASRNLIAVRLVHRLGVLQIGETSVAAVVAAPHRAEAFDACRELIEMLKASVPIFKRELWDRGNPTWVDPR